MARPSNERRLIGSITVTALAVVTMASVGCGDTDPGATMIPDCLAAAGEMLPWKTGNK